MAPAITPELQVKLLALVDETDGVSLGDCMAALPDTNIVDAVLVLVEHGLLAFDMSAPFDQHLQIRRVSKTADEAECAAIEARPEAVPSANGPTSFLRAEYLFSGILVEDGACLRLTRDLDFDSGSGAAQFVTGGKGHGLAAWQEVDEIPDAVLAPFAGRRLGPAR